VLLVSDEDEEEKEEKTSKSNILSEKEGKYFSLDETPAEEIKRHEKNTYFQVKIVFNCYNDINL
jgi:hypothetical protein